MKERLYEYLEISDLKDMLNKTKELYGEKPAYKIRVSEGNYKIYTHNEVREMIDCIRNSINKYGTKR